MGDHEAARVELRRGGLEVGIVRRPLAEAGNVHGEHVVAGVAVDHPVRQRQPDGGALRVAGHHAARRPVVRHPAHGSDQRVAVGGEGEGTVDPALDADVLQYRKAPQPDFQFGADAIGLLRKERHAEVPVGALNLPVARILLVNAEQHAVLLALQVREPLEIGHGRHHVGERGHLSNGLGDQVVVGHRRDGVVDAHHAAHPAGPQPGGVDHVLGHHGPEFGIEPPEAVGRAGEVEHPVVQHHVGPTVASGRGVSVGGAVGVEVALVRVEQPAHKPFGRHDRHEVDNLVNVE